MSTKEAIDKYSKAAFYGCLLALPLYWLIKLFGITQFNLDLNVPVFVDISNFITINNLTNVYYTITLTVQCYFIYGIVQLTKGKRAALYCICLIPFTVIVRLFTSYYETQLGNWAIWIEFIYMVIVMAQFNYRRIAESIFTNLFIILYQACSVLLRNYAITAHQYNLITELLLSLDYYILLILHREVAIMNGGTWFIFGPTAWLYAVAGFIVGIFKRHPIIIAKEYYAKGKAKENARKAKRANKTYSR